MNGEHIPAKPMFNRPQTCGAGPVTVTRYKAGVAVSVEEIPAPSVESVRDRFAAKRGPKPKVVDKSLRGKPAEDYQSEIEE